MWRFATAVGACLLVACGSAGPPEDAGTSLAPAAVVTAAPTAPTVVTSAPTTAPPGPEAVTVAMRLERRVTDPATSDFADVVRAVLTDPRGWQQAGFAFTFDDPAAPYTVVLAEGPEVDATCLPYETFGRFSCQIGPVVALNADRWRGATDSWFAAGGDLESYRAMLVNHEVGHLLGQHHPDTFCPAPGAPAPVMAQQSTTLDGCLPNPWPLAWELACAASRVEPLAPPHEPDPAPLCGP